MMWWWWLVRWARRLFRRPLSVDSPSIDSGEICRVCLRELTVAEAWETIHHLSNTAEMGSDGGTYLTAYWCAEHRPDGALPFRA